MCSSCSRAIASPADCGVDADDVPSVCPHCELRSAPCECHSTGHSSRLALYHDDIRSCRGATALAPLPPPLPVRAPRSALLRVRPAYVSCGRGERPCPGCGIGIYKDGGCNYVECRCGQVRARVAVMLATVKCSRMLTVNTLSAHLLRCGKCLVVCCEVARLVFIVSMPCCCRGCVGCVVSLSPGNHQATFTVGPSRQRAPLVVLAHRRHRRVLPLAIPVLVLRLPLVPHGACSWAHGTSSSCIVAGVVT